MNTAKNALIDAQAGAAPSGLLKRPMGISENGLEVLRRRYLRKGLDGKPVETVPEMFWRVAANVALPERAWGDETSYLSVAEQYYDLLTSLRFFPNSPTFTGAGTPLGQLAACFVLAIEDDMGKDSGQGIFNTLRNAALIQQTGGGNGFSFSRLRPEGDSVASSAGVASGPVGFLRVYDAAFGEIAQGGTRRGANMGVLRVDHPDIEAFIACKAEEGQITNFNISVGVTDAFMEAVRDDTDFDLVNPRNGEVARTVRARDLFEKIVAYAHRNGEPGVLFLDVANRSNPVPHLYQLEATNPCGEQWLGPFENCCLGSINLAQHLTADGRVDWARLQATVETSTRFLDDVVSANKYVPAVPELQDAAHRVRRIGLGIMGLADMMFRMEVRYGDQESLDLAGQVMEFVRYHCMHTSIELARERGAFPAISGSIYDPQDLIWHPPTPLQPYSHGFDRPELDWNAILAGIKQHGIRNGAQTTVAPTGTIGTVAGCEGYGCEPVFALAYTRYVKERDGDVSLTYVSPLFLEALEQAHIDGDRRADIIQQILHSGTCQDIEALPAAIRHTFVVSQDITPQEHVMMQAVLQRFVDNSISKCIVGDSLVLTANGLAPIEELSGLRLDDQFEALHLEVASPAGVETAGAFYYGGFRETRLVQMAHGYQIEGTPNHRIQVLGASGAIVFRRLDQIRPGDTAVLYAGQRRNGSPAQPLPTHNGVVHTNGKAVQFPDHMSSDLAFLLGCITAHGSVTRHGVAVSHTNLDLLAQLQEIVQDLFGLVARIIHDRRQSVYVLDIDSRPLRTWLLADLGMESGTENKVIPSCILRAGPHEVAAFLRGLMLDGRVASDGMRFDLTLAGEKLIRQLQVLLLNLGVLAAVQPTGDRLWCLSTQGEALAALASLIGFVEVWQSDSLAIGHYPQILRSSPKPLPAAASAQALPASSLANLRQPATVHARQPQAVERSAAESAHKVFVEVQGVTAGFAEVFDISVPGSHSFIANGVGNHNTCNFPADATREDVGRAYMMAWELACKGLTVYVTGSRQEVVLETQATADAKRGSVLEPTPNGRTSAAEALNATVLDAEEPADGSNGHEASHPNPMISPFDAKRPRPRHLHGTTYRRLSPLGTAYVTVNDTDDGEPFEVFMNVGKAGSDVAAVSEALGRLISLVLRLPSSLTPTERLQQVVYQLNGIGGGRHLGFGPQRVRSLPDAIAQVLAEHLSEVEHTPPPPSPSPAEQLALPMPKQIGDLCPDCGNSTLLNVEGCRKCHVCGYSEC